MISAIPPLNASAIPGPTFHSVLYERRTIIWRDGFRALRAVIVFRLDRP